MEEDLKSFNDFILIGWRRKYYILVPSVLLFVIIIYVVSILPPIYQSSATVLVESQKISQEFVRSTETNFAEERIHLLVKRIMTSKQLLEIADEYDIFAEQGSNYLISERLKDMKKRVLIKIVGADGKRLRSDNSSTLAFTLSFEDRSPGVAQKVVDRLVTLFLKENIRSRTELVEETTEFLKKEGDRLGVRIEGIEKKIVAFKQKNEGSLPETLTVSLQQAANLRTEFLKSDSELSSLEGQRDLLRVELKTLKNKPAAVGGISAEKQALRIELKQLQNKFITLSARYGSEHPDVKSASRQIVAFRNEYGNLSDKKELQLQRKQAEDQYAEVSSKYAAEHPDVKRLERKLQSISQMISQFDNSASLFSEEFKDPKVLQTETRLSSILKSINRLDRSRENLQLQIALLEKKISKIPEVERGIDVLERDYDNTKQKYQELKSKQLQAELSKSLEEDRKGERFTLLEPAFLADSPIKPKRLQLLVLGFGLSLLCGIGAASLAESLDSGIRGARALAAVTKMTPLVTIPYITTARDGKIRIRNIIISMAAVLIVAGVVLVILHNNYKPMDLIWLDFMQKLNAI